MGLSSRLLLAAFLLFSYVSSKPSPPDVHNYNHDSDNDKNAQDGVCSSVHKVDTAASEGDAPEGDPSMNKEVVLTEPDQDNELGEEYDEVPEEEQVTADKRGGSGSLHRTHSSRNRTLSQKQKRADRSSEEDDKLELLSADHVAHKRSAHDEHGFDEQGHKEHDIVKRSTKQSFEEEDSDGSFDGLEYVGEFEDKEKGEREKRNHHHEQPEETVEAEELPSFPSDMSQHVQSVALRVKRVNKAGSSHRNRLITKNKGNSKAGQAEEQPPSVMIDPMK